MSLGLGQERTRRSGSAWRSRNCNQGSRSWATLRAGIIPVTPFQQNCTVLFDQDTKSGVVIDPGGDVDVILQTIAENDLTIEAIWLTHGHIDHAGGADELPRKAQAADHRPA